MGRTGSRGRWVCASSGSALLAASAVLLSAGQALAADAQSSTVQELVVTAQKREENVQRVPMSIQLLNSTKLQQLGISNFYDYQKFLPSVSFSGASISGTTGGAPGIGNVYMRGVVSGNDGNHSSSLPSVGVYLDEQPITTIGGTLDIHIYDIARVEALAGPQGTLYGASSQAGTLRIITNQPRLGTFEASYDAELNKIDHGAMGDVVNGMVNLPIGDKAAIRLVAWQEHDAGYIDNVKGTFPAAGIIDGVRTFPTSGATETVRAKNDYNTVNTWGGRAELKIDLNENWTLEPSLMGQDQKTNGFFAYDPNIGDLKVSHFRPEFLKDRWYQAGLTIRGEVNNFDIVYTTGFMSRHLASSSDYSDYAFFYDQLFGYGAYITDNSGNFIDPTQQILAQDHFTKQSHEFRISTPQDKRLRAVFGVFYERQTHFIEQNYAINGLADATSVTGWPGTLWLTEQERTDRDYAAFGEATFDITPKLSLTGGIRVFNARNSLVGFFGFASSFSSHTGEATCFAPGTVGRAPCTDLDKTVTENGETHKVNLTYKIDDTKLLYFTYSTGFRPGGVNRRGSVPPYAPDWLTNYEVGWKTSWLDNKLRFNGALFWDDWNNIQFSALGLNAFTEIRNAGDARILGAEADINFRPDSHWSFEATGTYTDASLQQDYCGVDDPATNLPVTVCPGPLDPNPPQAPKGTALPLTPKFKGSAMGRYDFPLGELNAHVQTVVTYQSSAWPDLRVIAPNPVTGVLDPIRSALGLQRGYSTVDFSAGIAKGNWFLDLSLTNAFDTRADLYRFAECTVQNCETQPYILTNRPRTVAIKFGQKF
jgi:outer membrane receptor protein involved in Fe transport